MGILGVSSGDCGWVLGISSGEVRMGSGCAIGSGNV